jgi:KaiC/GvpD/RAD55 family RecA-like ATPase
MIVARIPSGVPGLDSVLQGGIPVNSTIALRADPSNHTELFQQQFIAEGLKNGNPAIYCCLSRPVANVIKSMRHQGFDVLEHIANDRLIFIDCYSMHKTTAAMGVDAAVHKKIIAVTQLDDENMLQEGLVKAVERIPDIKGIRAVCESVPGALTMRNAVEIVRWGRTAFGELRAFETVSLHTFPVGVREEMFSHMAHDFDGIFELKVERSSDRVRYYLSIPKMRMTEVPPKMYDLEVENGLLTLKTMITKIT